MSKTVIKIENLSKLYRIGEIGTGTISHDLNRWWTTKIRGKEDPYAQVGQVNDRTSKAEKGEHVWALKDINLEVKQGDILGIIGKNGAGKSTLLKLLSRVTSPTTGSIKVKGRLASLLEVGTGFHPEMTGRENIYMNGTIMGMRRWEIDRKLDEIVDFAGIEKYLDTPTKRYSSGMTVRLGFAIAAFLEPEILVVDEVLAVGDAEFQKKAIGKMQDVSQGQGRTVLFVSHNMQSILSLCFSGIVVNDGKLIYKGDVSGALNRYKELSYAGLNIPLKERVDRIGTGEIKAISLLINDGNTSSIEMGSNIKFSLTVVGKAKSAIIGILIGNGREDQIIRAYSHENYSGTIEIDGTKKIDIEFKNFPLNHGSYKVDLWLGNFIQRPKHFEVCDVVQNVEEVHVIPVDYYNSGFIVDQKVQVICDQIWKIE